MEESNFGKYKVNKIKVKLTLILIKFNLNKNFIINKLFN